MLFGAIAIDSKAGCETSRVVDDETDPKAAVMLVAPKPALVARPWLPELLLITATVAEVELHVTFVVMSCVVPSV